MEEFYETLLFDDTPTERATVRKRLSDDPALARAWAHWCAVRSRIRKDLADHLPGHRLLVLYALDEAGHGAVLSADEQEALRAAREDIARAIDTVPALERVVERIQEDQEAFDEAWATQMDGAPTRRASDADARPRASDRDERGPRSSTRRSQGNGRQWTRRLAVAALFVGVAVLALLYWPGGASTTTVTVVDGETRVIDLADGSTVRLVGEATLTYPADLVEAEARRVTLSDGRAFFEVERRSEDASFVVETPTATATVLGTQFGVQARADTTSVVLAEGRVEVGALRGSSAPVMLAPGQQSRVVGEQSPTPPASVDLTAALDWTGLFVFRSTPMSTIATRLQQHHEVEIAVAPALQAETVSGDFEQDQPVQEVLRTLAKTLGAEVQSPAEGRYRLVPAK